MSKQKSNPLAHIFTKSSPIFWFALVLVLLFLALLSNYLPIREVLSIAGSVVILYFAWISKSMPLSVASRILCTLSAAKLTANALLDIPRLYAIGTAILVTAFAFHEIYTLLHKESDKHHNSVATFLFMLELIFTISVTKRYTYLHTDIAFWLPALAVALVLTIAALILLSRRPDLKKDKAHLCLAVPFLSFAIVMFTLGNLNYALDTTNTSNIQAVVQEKRTSRSGGRNKTTFRYMTVVIQGEEMEIQVSDETYRSTEEGDTVTVVISQGAFGEAYASIP